MLTVKFKRKTPEVNNPYRVKWVIETCDSFQIADGGEQAGVVLVTDGCSRLVGLGDKTSDQYQECYVENEYGKTVHMWVLQKNNIVE